MGLLGSYYEKDGIWAQMGGDEYEMFFTMTYSILVHGHPYGNISPTRGIGQGDFLSPYFFILCAKGLSSLLHMARREKWIIVLSITRGGTRLNHLFVVDNSFLFCKTNTMEWVQIQHILKIYENASGQKINKEKTSIFFSKDTK